MSTRSDRIRITRRQAGAAGIRHSPAMHPRKLFFSGVYISRKNFCKRLMMAQVTRYAFVGRFESVFAFRPVGRADFPEFFEML